MDDGIDDLADAVIVPMKMASVTTTFGFDDDGIDHDGVPDEYIDTRCYWDGMYHYRVDGIDDLVDAVIGTDDDGLGNYIDSWAADL
jgi:hypothetical protein